MIALNMKKIELQTTLKAAHFELPRAKQLGAAFIKCVEEYYVSKLVEGMEVRGLTVTGESRLGKSREILKVIRTFNESETLMPDGRPARIVSCLLSGRVSFKDLGIKTLKALGYELRGFRTQEYIWEKVIDQAQDQGVIGIHYDECQHVFSDKADKTNRIFLDSFKSMMKEPRWPLMMILSGVPQLANYVRSYEQLDALMDPVHFKPINFRRDMDLLNRLLFAFADLAEVDIETLVTPDFLARLDHSCSHRWGLVIELLINTLIEAKLKGRTQLQIDDFVQQFALTKGLPKQFSPFTAPDFREAFDIKKLLAMGS